MMMETDFQTMELKGLVVIMMLQVYRLQQCRGGQELLKMDQWGPGRAKCLTSG